MKLCALILFLLPLSLHAQIDSLTKLDKLISGTPGSMIMKENIDLGKFKNGVVKLYKLTNLRSQNSIYYVMLDYEGAFGSSVPGNVTISIEEMPGIIDAIEYLSKISYKPKAENKEEYYYETTDNLKLYLYCSNGWQIGIGNEYYSSSRFKTGQHIYMKPSVFDELVPILKKSLHAKF